MKVLAVDAGTTGVTAVVVDPRGRVVARAHEELGHHVPRPGWVEQAPEEIWQATTGAVRTVLGLVDASELTALGVANQRETVVLWDRDTLGSPRPAIAGQDRRTADLCERMRGEGHGQRVGEITGLPLGPCFPGTVLAWLAEEEPHTWAHVESGRYAVGTVDSYLVARMTRGLEHVTDASNASRTLLLDLGAGEWSDEMCSLLGVPPDALPELVPSWGEIAVTDPRTFCGLSLPVAGIAGDRQAALVGQACFDAGESACTSGGESSVLVTTGTTLERAATGLLPTAAWRSPGGRLTYALEGALPATGAARGVRATREAVAAGVRDVLAALPDHLPGPSSLRLGGGADDLLCQAVADLAGIPVERSAVVETAALGAAFLAGLGAGVWSSTDDLRAARSRPPLRTDPGRLGLSPPRSLPPGCGVRGVRRDSP